MRRGQFGNIMVDIVFWVLIIGIVAFLAVKFVKGGVDWIPGAGDL